MFAWFLPARYDLFILSLLAGGMTAALYAKKSWRDKATLMFTSVTFSFFTLPSLTLLLNWAFNVSSFTNDAAKMGFGYCVTLGGNYVVEKIIDWWSKVSLDQLVQMVLRRRLPPPEEPK
jgi:hypothetical protein